MKEAPKRCRECPYRMSNYIYECCMAYNDGTIQPALTDEEIYDARPDWCTKYKEEECS